MHACMRDMLEGYRKWFTDLGPCFLPLQSMAEPADLLGVGLNPGMGDSSAQVGGEAYQGWEGQTSRAGKVS